MASECSSRSPKVSKLADYGLQIALGAEKAVCANSLLNFNISPLGPPDPYATLEISEQSSRSETGSTAYSPSGMRSALQCDCAGQIGLDASAGIALVPDSDARIQ